MMERLASAPTNTKHFACRLWESNIFYLIWPFFLKKMLAEEVHLMKHTCSRICGADLYLLMTLPALLHLLQWTLRPGQERIF